MLFLRLLCGKAVLELQGCGGDDDYGGYGSHSGDSATPHPDPPKPPGPCECIGSAAYKEKGRGFHKYPEDAGKWCYRWDLEYNRNCKHRDNEDTDDWKMEWCEKEYCLVPKDCEVDDTKIQYEGNFKDSHKMDQMWSSKNCDGKLWQAEETTASP
jgi:hypothetical protein